MATPFSFLSGSRPGVDTCNFQIHPSIRFKGHAIANVTGTRLEVETRRSSEKSPRRKRRLNTADKLPKDLIGKYDLVYVRLLPPLAEKVKARVVGNLYRLLRPGGYIQWDELDGENMRVRRDDPGAQTPAMDKICEGFAGSRGSDEAVEVPRLLAGRGFVSVEMESWGEKLDLESMARERWIVEAKGWVDDVDDGRIWKDAYQESLQGAALWVPRIVVVGKRPMRRCWGWLLGLVCFW
ncbi:hypothetical protein BDV25DRAFT_140470 [Aspergillus avenaceus]|uniref:Methyltransferase type 11 domain-containing protein n=1 Tax=Aspergillus avenaceus TaxID=36643 RepID=A0A5N6TTR8_ASPAV|nr:hypothetical protein BDV25DRAFT_140470 [Aspergillus avenaceus]